VPPQNRVDEFSKYGIVAGALALALAAGAGPLLVRVGGGAALGMVGGVLAHLAFAAREGGPARVQAEVEGALPVKAVEETLGRR
jgi:hypothetical protein